MWTPSALASEARPWAHTVWRIVESASITSTLKLVDTLGEQALLEDLLERGKPPVPPECAGLDFLMAAPFRYASYPHGSRFRRAQQRDGAYYASENVRTAMAEMAFYRLLFFSHAPGVKLPANPVEHTAFRVGCRTAGMLDLTLPPLSHDEDRWTHLTDYQDLADAARQAGIEVLRYHSVRDPHGGMNAALFTPLAFTAKKPDRMETWSLFVRPTTVQAIREFPRLRLEFPVTLFSADPRMAVLLK